MYTVKITHDYEIVPSSSKATKIIILPIFKQAFLTHEFLFVAIILEKISKEISQYINQFLKPSMRKGKNRFSNALYSEIKYFMFNKHFK